MSAFLQQQRSTRKNAVYSDPTLSHRKSECRPAEQV